MKSLRVLRDLGVEQAIASGARVVPVGPSYDLADGRRARVAFCRDDDGTLHVGWAAGDGREWVVQDSRPYSARALGYFRRRVRRVAVEPPDEEEDET